MFKGSKKPPVLQRENRVSGRQASPEKVRRASGRRQESPERIDNEAGSVQYGNSRRDDTVSVTTAKSQKSIQWDRILEVEDQVADLEQQITALEVKHRANEAELRDRKDKEELKLEKLKEDFNSMKRNNKNYNKIIEAVAVGEFALRKLTNQIARPIEDQKAETRILNSKLKSAMRKADNEKSQLEEILEEEAQIKGRVAGPGSINSEERRLNTEHWINDAAYNVKEVKPQEPTAIEERCTTNTILVETTLSSTPSWTDPSSKKRSYFPLCIFRKQWGEISFLGRRVSSAGSAAEGCLNENGVCSKDTSAFSSLTIQQTLCKIIARQSIGKDFPVLKKPLVC